MLSSIQKFYPNVKSIVSPKKPVIIEVTKRDATSGKRRNHKACALAVACEKKFNAEGVVIGRTTAFVIKGNTALRFALPPSIGREITSFDRGSDFAPGTYQLSVASIPHCRKRGKNTNNGKKRRFRHVTANIRASIKD